MKLVANLSFALCLSWLISAGYAAESLNTFDKDYGATKDWQRVDTASTLSQYVYHDMNDNGLYDLGDIAMSSIKVELEYESPVGALKAIKQSETNGNGFANFKARTIGRSSVIKQPGSYRVSVLVPPGWHATSNNTVQSVRIVARPDTRSGLFLLDRMVPVGLAQDKWIQGSVVGELPITVELKNRAGKVLQSQTLEQQNTFKFMVDQGEYWVGIGRISRTVKVSHLPVYIGSLEDKGEVSTNTQIATFDDLPQHGIYKIPNGYLNVNWEDINTLRRDYTRGVNEGYVNGVTSGSYVAYTSQSRHGQIKSEDPFDFISVNLSSSWRAAEGQQVLIEMWRGDKKLVSDTVRLSVLGPIKYVPEVADVTRVQFSPLHGWQAVFDDMVIAKCDRWWCRIW